MRKNPKNVISYGSVDVGRCLFTADSSIGRAEDCSRFRLLSSGRWFDSGSAESFF